LDRFKEQLVWTLDQHTSETVPNNKRSLGF